MVAIHMFSSGSRMKMREALAIVIISSVRPPVHSNFVHKHFLFGTITQSVFIAQLSNTKILSMIMFVFNMSKRDNSILNLI